MTKSELIEEVAKRRAAMHFLKNDPGARDAILKPLDPTSARNIRSLIESDENFTRGVAAHKYGRSLRTISTRLLVHFALLPEVRLHRPEVRLTVLLTFSIGSMPCRLVDELYY